MQTASARRRSVCVYGKRREGTWGVSRCLAVARWLFFLCGLLVWLLASRSRDESRDESPFFSPTPTTEKKKSATPDAPRLLGHCARSVPLFVPSRSLTQKARRGDSVVRVVSVVRVERVKRGSSGARRGLANGHAPRQICYNKKHEHEQR